MKIVNFSPGLGNQIFEYAFVEYLRNLNPNERIYGYYNPKFLNKHNGLEIHKYFDVNLPPESELSNFIALACRMSSRIIPNLKATDSKFSTKAFYFDGWWQDKRYFGDTIKKIKFRQLTLDEFNQRLIDDILVSDSVSLHIRRGDYLTPNNIKRYGGICTLDYYNEAISIIKNEYSSPYFYVFSNDIEWCKANLDITNAVYVSNNVGSDSWKDMYLMSRCKANILANSSFSYWGAMLNVNSPQTVIFPKKWFNTHTPDIFPDYWKGI